MIGSPAETVATVVGTLAAISFAVAAFFGLRNRETLSAAREAAEAWRSERDAAVAKADRLAVELTEAKGRITVLEARVEEMSRRQDVRPLMEMIERHESRAELRADRIVAALERLAPTTP